MRTPLLWVASVLLAAHSDAQVTRIEIAKRISPVPGTEAIGPAGAYEHLQGRVHGELDPADPHNRIIQDIGLAPRNARALARDRYLLRADADRLIAEAAASGILPAGTAATPGQRRTAAALCAATR